MLTIVLNSVRENIGTDKDEPGEKQYPIMFLKEFDYKWIFQMWSLIRGYEKINSWFYITVDGEQKMDKSEVGELSKYSSTQNKGNSA